MLGAEQLGRLLLIQLQAAAGGGADTQQQLLEALVNALKVSQCVL